MQELEPESAADCLPPPSKKKRCDENLHEGIKNVLLSDSHVLVLIRQV